MSGPEKPTSFSLSELDEFDSTTWAGDYIKLFVSRDGTRVIAMTMQSASQELAGRLKSTIIAACESLFNVTELDIGHNKVHTSYRRFPCEINSQEDGGEVDVQRVKELIEAALTG